jgi:hypothetical protein
METWRGNQLFESARRIFDVAVAGADVAVAGADMAASGAGDFGETQDFALLIRPDGGIHFVMESPFSIEAAAVYAGAQCAFRITRSRNGVRVEGRSGSADCVMEMRKPRQMLLPDQPLYCISSPLLTAGSAT